MHTIMSNIHTMTIKPARVGNVDVAVDIVIYTW